MCAYVLSGDEDRPRETWQSLICIFNQNYARQSPPFTPYCMERYLAKVLCFSSCLSGTCNFPIVFWSLGKRIVFFLLPEAFCGLEHAENAIAAGAPPRTLLGELTTLPQTPSRLGRGHPSPYPTPLGAFGPSMLALSARRSSCPLTPNPGDATGHPHFSR